MRLSRFLLLACTAALPAAIYAQAPDTYPYSRRNTFTTFAEYSNDSSHIILGTTPNRKLAAAGFQYERRLLATPHLTWSYVAEFRPFLLSSDPLTHTAYTITSTDPKQPPFSGTNSLVAFKCSADTFSNSYTNPATGYTTTIDETITCSRQHTFAQALAPIGFRVNLRPQHPLQVTFSSNGGYMFSTRPIPIAQTGSFNFTFEFGGGLEYFRPNHRSVRLEYLVQHYSNHSTADQNPGVDSGFVKLTYAFGR